MIFVYKGTQKGLFVLRHTATATAKRETCLRPITTRARCDSAYTVMTLLWGQRNVFVGNAEPGWHFKLRRGVSGCRCTSQQLLFLPPTPPPPPLCHGGGQAERGQGEREEKQWQIMEQGTVMRCRNVQTAAKGCVDAKLPKEQKKVSDFSHQSNTRKVTDEKLPLTVH